MTIAYKHETNKITGESKVIFLNTLFLEPFTNLNELLQQQKPVIHSMFPVKKYAQFRFIKRLSPFLLTVLFLPTLFIYLFFEGKGYPQCMAAVFSIFFLRK